eukprot:gene1706-3305_t
MRPSITAAILFNFISTFSIFVNSKNQQALQNSTHHPQHRPFNRKVIKFVIFANQRTGSTFLCELLSHHPSVVMNYEIFNMDNNLHTKIVYKQLIPNALLIKRKEKPKEFLNKIWSLSNGKLAVGFKIFPNHINQSDVKRLLLLDTSIKKIILIRSDILSVYMSYMAAKEAHAWSKLDTSNFKYKSIISDLQSTNQSYMLLEYNNDLNKEIIVQTSDNIQTFLGLRKFDSNKMFSSTTLIKQARTPIQLRISNWDALPQSIQEYANRNLNFLRTDITTAAPMDP